MLVVLAAAWVLRDELWPYARHILHSVLATTVTIIDLVLQALTAVVDRLVDLVR